MLQVRLLTLPAPSLCGPVTVLEDPSLLLLPTYSLTYHHSALKHSGESHHTLNANACPSSPQVITHPVDSDSDGPFPSPAPTLSRGGPEVPPWCPLELKFHSYQQSPLHPHLPFRIFFHFLVLTEAWVSPGDISVPAAHSSGSSFLPSLLIPLGLEVKLVAS